LACFEEPQFSQNDSRTAHVVLSPSGRIGGKEQIRLRLDDVDGLWAVLQGRDLVPQRAAA
jgi:hypothetical protein